MPMPWTYRHPETEWRGFLEDIRDILDTPSSNVAYTAAEGVLTAFRRRLTPQEVLEFADTLPSVIRALFLQGWRMEAPLPWAKQSDYIREAKALRRDHNFTGDRVLEAVSFGLHRAVGAVRFRQNLNAIGPEAQSFWALTGYSEEDLAFRFRSAN